MSSSSDRISVTVWNEYRHEKTDPVVASHYPDGIHRAIADFLSDNEDFDVRTATLDEPDHGLGGDVLENTDVLLWWGHKAHGEVSDATTEAVVRRVHEGMGFIGLHSAHFAKPFRSLMGGGCALKWRAENDTERVWTILPQHPIAAGVPPYFEMTEEMYGEPFTIPTPDELIFISWFTGGEVFRSGATWYRGAGRVFYFRPGHETYPSYHNEHVQRVVTNAVRWARPTVRVEDKCQRLDPIEPLPAK